MNTTTSATAATENASRYLQQLCKHWSHKMPVEFAPDAGTVTFPSGAVAILAAHADHIAVTIAAPTPEMIPAMRDVVARHLDRFAFREAPLAFIWE
jgi:hypothetical protein